MRVMRKTVACGAATTLFLGLGTTSASAAELAAGAEANETADAAVAATLTVPVAVGPASVKVYRKKTDTEPTAELTTPGIAAGSEISVNVGVSAQASAGANVGVSTNDPRDVLQITPYDRETRCFVLGADVHATVEVQAGADADASASAAANVTVNVPGAEPAVAEGESVTLADVTAGDSHTEVVEETPRVEVCLPSVDATVDAEVDVAIAAAIDAVIEAKATA